MFQDDGNAGDFDIYCGYTPLSHLEEPTGHYQKSPDPAWNLHTLDPSSNLNILDPSSNLNILDPSSNRHTLPPVPQGTYSLQSDSEGSPYSLHTIQPMQQLWDPSPYLGVSEGSPFNQVTLRPTSEGSPYGLHNMQPMLNWKVSDGSPYSPQLVNKTIDFVSSLPEEFGEEFTENLANTRRQELGYECLPYYNSTGLSNWDAFFSTNEKHLKDMYDREEYDTENGEVEPKKFENGQLVQEKSDYGKIDNRDCDKEVKYDNVDNSMKTALNESSKSDDSEEEELIVIDSDTDDIDEISELSQKYQKYGKYCEYPVGKCNTVIVSENDYRSLECNKFLNDIIIDFYLNYIFVHILPVEHQPSVHVFSTLFYKRLLQVPKKKRKCAGFEEDCTVPMAEKRHRRVSGWTKDIDLFSKSVLVIPICENSHWYLLMVVGLSGVASHPFIVVLDSLGGLRNKAVHIIRQYLAYEYEAKQMEGNLDFIPSVRPAKPEQPNGTDCGVYLLHYAEMIFKNIQNFLSPNLPCLKNWFSHEEVAKKRSDIAHLIRNLAKEQKDDNDLQFPDSPFTLEKDSEVVDGMELDVEEVKIVDDFVSRLEHLTDQNSVKNSEMTKEIVCSEIKKTSTSRKRVVRKKIEKITCSGDSKATAPSTSTSTSILLPEKNPITQTELKAPSSYCKSYSKGFKIPRIKNSDSTTKQTATFLTEADQTLPTSDDGMSGTDSTIGKLGSSKSKIGAATRVSKSTMGAATATSCPVYGDRCESAYHRHPNVKNKSRKSKDDSNGEVASGDIDGQYLQNWGIKKCNIVDKFLTGTSEKSND